ncbi:uncharacterized protein G2W53_028095 [Senna tora]|uniref:Uncharacterized protein n=1 Tax=Senna tora TaxID=362788 RepID=A0A834T4M3_9FABA|nr:uncharacterized protein G2W53_028095 [Senna tora]
MEAGVIVLDTLRIASVLPRDSVVKWQAMRKVLEEMQGVVWCLLESSLAKTFPPHEAHSMVTDLAQNLTPAMPHPHTNFAANRFVEEEEHSIFCPNRLHLIARNLAEILSHERPELIETGLVKALRPRIIPQIQSHTNLAGISFPSKAHVARNLAEFLCPQSVETILAEILRPDDLPHSNLAGTASSSSKLKEFSITSENMTSLDLQGTDIKELPSSIGHHVYVYYDDKICSQIHERIKRKRATSDSEILLEMGYDCDILEMVEWGVCPTYTSEYQDFINRMESKFETSASVMGVGCWNEIEDEEEALFPNRESENSIFRFPFGASQLFESNIYSFFFFSILSLLSRSYEFFLEASQLIKFFYFVFFFSNLLELLFGLLLLCGFFGFPLRLIELLTSFAFYRSVLELMKFWRRSEELTTDGRECVTPNCLPLITNSNPSWRTVNSIPRNGISVICDTRKIIRGNVKIRKILLSIGSLCPWSF